MNATVPVTTPTEEAELLEVLIEAQRCGQRVVPIGSGSRLAGYRPDAEDADLWVSLSAFDGVLDYVSGDGTLTAQAGATHGALAAVVHEGGHVLTPDLPPQRTLGGTLASGESGFDRRRFGPSRHHVLGARVAFMDGSVARSGGKLVKNVTGFDLHRLYTGSRGTLCVLLEASLRLFPAPDETRRRVWRAQDARELVAKSRALRESSATVQAEVIVGEGGQWEWQVVVAGMPETVHEALSCLDRVAGAPEEEHGDDGQLSKYLESQPQFVMTARPSEAERLLDHAADLEASRVILEPTTASARIDCPVPELTSDSARDLRFLRRFERGAGIRLEPRAVPLEWHRELAPRAGEAPGLDWMFSLQRELDPSGVLRSPVFPGRSEG